MSWWDEVGMALQPASEWAKQKRSDAEKSMPKQEPEGVSGMLKSWGTAAKEWTSKAGQRATQKFRDAVEAGKNGTHPLGEYEPQATRLLIDSERGITEPVDRVYKKHVDFWDPAAGIKLREKEIQRLTAKRDRQRAGGL